jgi:Protein of unknown function (DUF4003)
MKHKLPENPLARFEELYDALAGERSWWRDPSPLRFASMSALTCSGSPEKVAASIRGITDNLRTEGGLLGRLSRSLQFIVAAMLLGQGDTARDFCAEVKRVRALFREEGIRRAAIYETMAVLILRMQAKQRPVERKAVRRLKDIYEEMKRHHWWLTGPEDIPSCAILCGQDSPVERIVQKSEDVYQSLAKKKHSKGDPLQTAANILCMVDATPAKIAKRYIDLGNGFRESGVSIWQSDYDELAILTFLNHPTKRVIDCVLDHRETMKTLKPKPDRSLTFNLAASTTFMELARMDKTLKTVADVKALMDMQAIIHAQQAAAAAAAGAAAASAAS